MFPSFKTGQKVIDGYNSMSVSFLAILTEVSAELNFLAVRELDVVRRVLKDLFYKFILTRFDPAVTNKSPTPDQH